MSNAGLVLSRRKGRSIIYSADSKFFIDLIRYRVIDCCREDMASIRDNKKEVPHHRILELLLARSQGDSFMKRLHLHIGIDEIEEGIEFNSRLFGAEPVKRNRTMPNGYETIRPLFLQFPPGCQPQAWII